MPEDNQKEPVKSKATELIDSMFNPSPYGEKTAGMLEAIAPYLALKQKEPDIYKKLTPMFDMTKYNDKVGAAVSGALVDWSDQINAATDAQLKYKADPKDKDALPYIEANIKDLAESAKKKVEFAGHLEKTQDIYDVDEAFKARQDAIAAQNMAVQVAQWQANTEEREKGKAAIRESIKKATTVESKA